MIDLTPTHVDAAALPVAILHPCAAGENVETVGWTR
jgi:hypothetical protein